METKISKISDPGSGAFLEQKCCIQHGGHNFCAGGPYLGINQETGRMGGMLYGSWTPDPVLGDYVSSWDGSLKLRAIFGREYRNNFGVLCRYVWFRYNDRYFVGRWDGTENSQIVRVREISERSYFGSSYPAHVREMRRAQ